MAHIRSLSVGITILVLLLFSRVSKAQEWDEKLKSMSKESEFVVLGRVTAVSSIRHPEGKTEAVGTIKVKRHLKGTPNISEVDVIFRFGSHLSMKPDEENVIWFVRRENSGQRYLVTDWKWSSSSLGRVERILALVDKKTRIPNMPKPEPSEQPLSVVIAADDGTGRATTTKRLRSLDSLRLLVQFENHSDIKRTVMPCLDGSIVHWRYPHYDIEIRDEQNKLIRRGSIDRCGNVDPFRVDDFVSLAKGEVFRTTVPVYAYTLKPGKYEMRLIYTAKQDASTKGLWPVVDKIGDLIQTVWEGTLRSNWITIEIVKLHILHNKE